MRIRKWVAIAATAGIAFWTPSVIPVKAKSIGCGLVSGYQTIDTAYAGALPCPVVHGSSPWPAVVIIVDVVGVITNAAWIWHTQCRELSSQEAMTSTFLPFIGMAFDAQASKCH
jgi:hypothetical protein